MHRLAIALVAGALLVTPVAAQDFSRGYEAYKNGDYAAALGAFRALAEDRDAQARYYLGLMYERGLGVPPDEAKAMMWFRSAAELGSVYAQYNLGQRHLNYILGRLVRQDDAQAMKWFRLAAAQEHKESQHSLGFMYAHGLGAAQDHAQAAMWYRKAAGNGLANAQYDLGLMYYEGQGVPQDYDEALKWYGKAAEQGFSSAQHEFGLMYKDGKGVPRDTVRAYTLLDLAAGNGGLFSGDIRDALAGKMSPGQIAEARRMAREWMEKHGR